LQTTKKFNNLNLTKIEDLAKLKEKDQYVILRKQIGKNIDLLIDEANGTGEDSLENKEKDLKSISAHKTFQNTIFDYENLINELKELVNKIVQKLNYRNLTARTVFLVTKNRKNLNNVENTIEKAILLRKTQSKRILLDHYENQYEIIYSYALKLFDNYYNENGIDFLGIGLADLKDKIYIKKQLKFDQYFEDNFIKKEKSIIGEDNLDNLILNINGFFNNKILIKGKYLLKENKYQDKKFSNRDQIKFKI
jgi:DNA polymerase-4